MACSSPIVFVRAHKLFWDLIDQIQNIFFLHTHRQRFMIMGVEGFVKTRIKSKHFYTILKILCTYFYYKYELRRFKIDMTVRLSNDTLTTYLFTNAAAYLFKRSWKVYWFFGTFFQKKILDYSLSLSKHTEYYCLATAFKFNLPSRFLVLSIK